MGLLPVDRLLGPDPVGVILIRTASGTGVDDLIQLPSRPGQADPVIVLDYKPQALKIELVFFEINSQDI